MKIDQVLSPLHFPAIPSAPFRKPRPSLSIYGNTHHTLVVIIVAVAASFSSTLLLYHHNPSSFFNLFVVFRSPSLAAAAVVGCGRTRRRPMGRGKIEIKRIENSANRQVTFSKRRNGIIKKAREISVLCDAQVSIVIFSSSGKMYEYCSSTTTLSRMLEKYQQHSGKKLWDVKHENLSAEIDRIKKENDNMQIELRHMKGADLNSLNAKELIPIEDALQNGLTGVREKQMEFLKMLKKNESLLEEENKRLSYILHHQQLAMNGSSARELELVGGFSHHHQHHQHHHHHHQKEEYPPHLQVAFRLHHQIHPNLHAE